MARAILLSDDEETYFRAVMDANLKGLAIHEVINGPCESSTRTRGIIHGFMRKLGLEVVEEPTPFPIEPEIPEPSDDLAGMADQMQKAMAPTLAEFTPGRVERIAGPLFVRLVSDAMDKEVLRSQQIIDLAATSLLSAGIFIAEMDERDNRGRKSL